MIPAADFWRDRRVLVTGHTGFKGAWLTLLLRRLGASVTGLALAPEPGPNAFELLRAAPLLAADHRADLRDGATLRALLRAARPEIVLHLAAQAFVGRGHREPAATFAVNLTGTIHLLEALRDLPGLAAALVVTSDKVYRNDGSGRAFREADPLGGADPYSASKAAAEIAVAAWRASFGAALPPIATARAGNVIGGGDFGAERLVPDLVRARQAGAALRLRRPEATRPFQHVLDVLRGYLLLAERVATGDAPMAVNFGPEDGEVRVRDLIGIWGEATGAPVPWEQDRGSPMPEAPRLGLDSRLAAAALGWRPRLATPAAIAETARWYAAWAAGDDLQAQAFGAIDRLVLA
ncbi:CDP-glucose 4,6-dehydratase [Roseicella frigidaeris]|uniref:CDP-glucose 4,6-dehydratase n=1 Tax=Roseicella frigidaeris TaxID=2230885 RepID=UPI001FB1F139|nr:CDP-glucose 4,6-dehydratase [Roseicella frigidaeris]